MEERVAGELAQPGLRWRRRREEDTTKRWSAAAWLCKRQQTWRGKQCADRDNTINGSRGLASSRACCSCARASRMASVATSPAREGLPSSLTVQRTTREHRSTCCRHKGAGSKHARKRSEKRRDRRSESGSNSRPAFTGTDQYAILQQARRSHKQQRLGASTRAAVYGAPMGRRT